MPRFSGVLVEQLSSSKKPRFSGVPVDPADSNAVASPPERTWGEAAKDSALSVGQSFANLGADLSWLVDTVTPGDMSAVTRRAEESARWYEEHKSTPLKSVYDQLGAADGFVETLKTVKNNPEVVPDILLGSIAYMLPLGAAGRAAGTARGATAAVAGIGGALEGAGAARQSEQKVSDMTLGDLLEQSSDYRQQVEQGVPPDEAKRNVQNATGLTTFAVTTPLAALASIITGAGKLESQFFKGQGAGGFFAGLAKESVEEAAQESANQFGANVGQRAFANHEQSLLEGVGSSAALGAVAGSGQAGAIGAVQLAARRSRQREEQFIDRILNGSVDDIPNVVASYLKEAEEVPVDADDSLLRTVQPGESIPVEPAPFDPAPQVAPVAPVSQQAATPMQQAPTSETQLGVDAARSATTAAATFDLADPASARRMQRAGEEIPGTGYPATATSDSLPDPQSDRAGSVGVASSNVAPAETVSPGVEAAAAGVAKDLPADAPDGRAIPDAEQIHAYAAKAKTLDELRSFVRGRYGRDRARALDEQVLDAWAARESAAADKAMPATVDTVRTMAEAVTPAAGSISALSNEAEKINLDDAAHQAATSPKNDLPEPTDAQKEAGNYKLGHIKVQNFDISIENPRGSKRSGVDPEGNAWEVDMAHHYGYLKRTTGADGEQVDVFVGPNTDSDKVFIVDQVNADGTFDEHKVMLGFNTKLSARKGYKANYQDGWTVGPITEMSIEQFKEWLNSGELTAPVSGEIKASAPKRAAKAKFDEAEATPVSRHTLPNPRKDWQGAPDAEIEIVQQGGKYYARASYATSRDGYGRPFGHSDAFATEQEALDDARNDIRGRLKQDPNDTHAEVTKAHDRIRDWLDTVTLGDPADTRSPVDNLKPGMPAEEPSTRRAMESKPAAAPAAAVVTESIQDLGEKIGGARKDTAVKTGRAAPSKPQDDRPAWARRFEIGEIVAGDDKGKFTLSDSRDLDWKNQPRQIGQFDTREEAEAAIPLAAVSQKHRVHAARDADGNTVFEIWRRINDRKRVKVVDRQFASEREAMQYMAEHAAEIVETNTTFGEADLPRPANTTREGAPRRTGDVKGQDFMDTFGLRAVEFGNWNSQEEREEVMNAAYDGLMDLAEVLGIPPRAIGLNGDLALAFGARGHGLTGARAHYEREKAVINLTKMKGAGALAHEWFHALDHYFGRQDGKASSEWSVGSDNTKNLKIGSWLDDYATHGFSRRDSGVRQEIRDAYKSLMQTIFTKAEGYVEDTQRVDMFVAAARDGLAKRLDAIRGEMSKKNTYMKRKSDPASAEQLGEFDTIAAKLLNGEFLETEARVNAGGKRRAMSYRWSNDALDRLSAIYKDVRGRSGFGSGKMNGPLDDVRSSMNLYSQRLKMLAEAQSGTEKTKRVPTAFATDAKSLDQGRGTDYWTTPHEMAARAFQGYVEERIADRSGRSPFLNYAPEKAALPTPWGWKRPYPAGDERKAINAEFDKLLSELKTEETPNGVRLFSQDWLVAETGTPGMSVDAVIEAITPAMEELNQQFGLDVEVLQTVAELPAAARRGVDTKARYAGAYHDGKVYLFADNLQSARKAQITLAHELIGHKGVMSMVDAQGWAEIKETIGNLLRSNSPSARKVAAEVDRRYSNLGPETDQWHAEFLAVAAEHREKSSPLQKLFTQLRQIIRRGLRALGMRGLFTDADIDIILSNSEKYLKRSGAETADVQTDPLFSAPPDIVSDWRRQVGALTKSTRPDFTVSVDAPLVLRHLGLLDKLTLTRVRFRAIHGKHSDLPSSVYVNLPTLLADPKAIYRRGADVGKGYGENNVVIQTETTDGNPIIVGIARGEIRTITPVHDSKGKTGKTRLADELAGSEILYARNEEALNEFRASVSDRLQVGTLPSPAVSPGGSTGPGPGRSKHKIVMKADIVKLYGREGEEGPLFSQAPPIESSAFRRWFGDSKAVDENGQPLVVYHGTARDFDAFDPKKGGDATRAESARHAMFFSSDPGIASDYTALVDDDSENVDEYEEYMQGGSFNNWESAKQGANVMPVYLSLQNPLIVDYEGADYRPIAFADAIKNAKQDGHDGVIFKNAKDAAFDTYDVPSDIYAVFRPEQIKSAIGNNGTFDPANPNILFSDGEPAAENRGIDAKLAKIADRVLAAPGKKTLKQKIRETFNRHDDDWKLWFRQGVVDQFASIADMEIKEYGELRDARDSAYKAAAFSKNTETTIDAAMNLGALQYKDGGIELVENTKGLVKIFEPLADAGLVREWELWAAATRAKRLLAEGRENLFTQDDVDTILGAVTGDKLKAYQKVHRQWTQYNARMLDFAEAAGLINVEERALWAKDDYVPFHRVAELADGQVASKAVGRRGGLSGQKSGITRLKGGVEKISIVESMVRNTAHLIDASMKNVAMQRVVKLAEKAGVVESVQDARITDIEAKQRLEAAGIEYTDNTLRAWKSLIEKYDARDGTVAVSVDGKAQRYIVHDPMLLRSITGLGPTGVEGIMKVLRLPKRMLTELVTADPAFSLRNLIRDTLSTWATVHGVKRNPISDAVKNVARAYRENDTLKAMRAQGIGGGGYYDVTPEGVRAHLQRMEGNAGVSTSIAEMWKWYKKVLGTTEVANRMAVYEAALKGGTSKAEAAYQAMDVLNFSRHGEFKAVRMLIELVPFMNARIQGLDRLYRGAKEGTTEWHQFNKAFMLKGAILTAATLALLAANWDREEYWDLEEFDRDTYYHFFVDGEHYRLPKPFEVGAIFSTIPERMFEQLRGDADKRLLGKRMLSMFADTFAFDPTPQFVKPALEVAMNRSSFTDRAILTQGMQYASPEAQYTPYTSKTFIELADAMPDSAPAWMRSPARLEHLFRGYMGTLGGYVLMGSDYAARKIADSPVRPEARLQDVPVVQSFVRDGEGSNKQVGRVYDMARDVSEIYAAISKYQEEGRAEKAQELIAANRSKLATRLELNRAVSAMSRISSAIKTVYDHPTWTPLQKRRRIDELTRQRNEMAKVIEDRYREYF